jgi:hypothetical protein
MGRGLGTINTENSPQKKNIELMEEFANQINAEIGETIGFQEVT